MPELPAQRSVDLPRIHTAGLAPQIVQHGLGPPALALFLRGESFGGLESQVAAQALSKRASPSRKGPKHTLYW